MPIKNRSDAAAPSDIATENSSFQKLNRLFLKGLFTILPLAATLYLITWFFQAIDRAFGTAIGQLIPGLREIPGAGLISALIVILLVGLVIENYLAEKIVDRIDRSLKRAPVIRAIYSPLKDLTELFSRAKGDGSQGPQKVVFVKMNDGLELIGLVMREDFSDLFSVPEDRDRLSGSVAVFLPFSYGVGGMTTLVSRNRLRPAGLAADRALQLAITGWVKAPKSRGNDPTL